MEHPHYIAVSNTNRVIVSDSNNHRIQIFDVNGRVLTAFGTEGCDEGQFKFPRSVSSSYVITSSTINSLHDLLNVFFYNEKVRGFYICIPHKYIRDCDFYFALMERPLGKTDTPQIQFEIETKPHLSGIDCTFIQKKEVVYDNFCLMIVIYFIVFYCFITFFIKT